MDPYLIFLFLLLFIAVLNLTFMIIGVAKEIITVKELIIFIIGTISLPVISAWIAAQFVGSNGWHRLDVILFTWTITGYIVMLIASCFLYLRFHNQKSW